MFDAIGRAFNPLMRLVARVLSFLYDLWPSYSGSIVLLTICVMTILTPVTIRSTKSMLAMRRLAPQVKRLQTEYRNDRQKMNEEVMALYRSNSVNPLGGCLPLLMQSPVFIALFYVLRGLTRRTSELGWSSGQAAAACASSAGLDCSPQLASAPEQTFNPDYLSADSQLYQDLVVSTEMKGWGLDLAQSASSALGRSFVSGLPYLGMIVLVAGLGYYQQRQISGRMSAEEQTPQARMMMRVIPVILPIISFSLSAGLVLYYNAQSIIRIGQQALITRKLYRPFAEEEAARKEMEEAVERGEEPVVSKPAEAPSGLAERLGLTSAPDPRRHGRQRPVSGAAPKPKPVPPTAKAPATAKAPPREPSAGRASTSAGSAAGSSRPARRERAGSNRRFKKDRTPAPNPVPSRVTPKGAKQQRSKRYKK
ncbi:MAG: YidC/Oxa1 family membrane protein insertase [bacterium]|nr:YidC/Oxa1 family membrane protein insertase [bacterium]MXZ29777.1 YidC/Oxa1 family membrane protein insertase [Acidimicrobiia bacterium]MYB24903.1 YidC/Oxa1 family membrane protein insertase [Acidimicrobiia bacterium]MYJ13969.1 YidC/Oxa1 family membrane protein insertase [Acidimicrobiia bacterium]